MEIIISLIVGAGLSFFLARRWENHQTEQALECAEDLSEIVDNLTERYEALQETVKNQSYYIVEMLGMLDGVSDQLGDNEQSAISILNSYYRSEEKTSKTILH